MGHLPLPVPYFRQILAVFVDILFVLNGFVHVSIPHFSVRSNRFLRRKTPFGLSGAKAGAEDENTSGKVNPQQHCHDPAERSIDRV